MKRKSNKSQYPGVTWDTKTPGWRVEVYTCGLRLYVGKYADEATAAAAHDAALWRWRGGDSKALENLNNPHLYSNPEQAPPDAETYLSPAALVRLEACQVEAALRASRSHPKNKVAKRKRPELSASGDSEGDATISDSKEDSDAEANDMLALDGHLHGSTKEGKLNARDYARKPTHITACDPAQSSRQQTNRREYARKLSHITACDPAQSSRSTTAASSTAATGRAAKQHGKGAEGYGKCGESAQLHAGKDGRPAGC
ncbi:hypothetical protein DUNSADRAFT_3179 [Dunaliella salina]|uniref:AP2/ERF domain-containing protein n=1 Tax=Dunaliella salina TaxID=3046 RepID=A0ABQ7GUP4_DUNSA|nr:hypothetical protein DUNSADRAFT_3179 [Dunaliella salina]|eukprot:KAF5838263.1 hypothetical protein DUNSADRAFT_3179 [Dunaliella salina]